MTPVGILGILILVLAVYCGTDPFKHSGIYEFPDFVAYKVKFINEVQGPESIAFDPLGRVPYTGVADGRIVFWDGQKWSDFAHTSTNRSELCDPKPSPSSYLPNEHICGRPLGLRFDKKTGDLYIADAYFGLMKVGPEGGLATSLVTEADGVPLRFTNDLDIDDEGNIYFTDSSTKYQRSGRLIKHNPHTKETTVLMTNLQFPNGVSLSKDGSFLVVCESCSGRLLKHRLKGEKSGTSEVFAILPGFPDNVRTNKNGEFWVAIHSRRSMYSHILGLYPKLRAFILKLPISAEVQRLLHMKGKQLGQAVKYGPDGKLLRVLEDSEGKVVKAVSEVDERDGKLWLGSVLMPFIAVYDLD
ncbi:Protein STRICTOSIDINE SYNTHASE-LIKE 3 [Hibiscus syriacus]|uniref:Protein STRICTOSIDINE SYNTHASE-LIKE 3 n=1 Tax=Hibiscus syriacus TaxID=106335 RepID=A0A6A2ZIP8_HIBSY|nr:Protein STRICTOSIDINE SYNTHASE-LIKE 3 [Hibiscus syriacus]